MHAFSQCPELATVILPDNLTDIGRSAFYSCVKMETLDMSGVTGLETIGDTAFSGSGLTAISIPEGPVIINEHMFFGCFSLAEASIPSTVTTIDSGAFSCPSMSKITFNSYTAPDVAADTLTSISDCELHIPAASSGYDVSPWTDTSIFSVIVLDS